MSSEFILSTLKQDTINSYEHIINRLDVHVHKKLLTDDSLDRGVALRITQEMINQVKDVMKQSIDNLDEYFFNNPNKLNETYEVIKRIALARSCCYIGCVKNQENWQLGLLIVCDWYLDRNEMNFLSNFDLENNGIKDKIKMNEVTDLIISINFIKTFVLTVFSNVFFRILFY